MSLELQNPHIFRPPHLMDVKEGLPGSAVLLRDQVHRLFNYPIVQTDLQESMMGRDDDDNGYEPVVRSPPHRRNPHRP